MNAEWRPIPGWEHYEVSRGGNVRNGYTGRILRGGLNKKGGYITVTVVPGKLRGISDDLKSKKIYVHRAVCLAFHGQPPSQKHQAAHRNGVSADNRAENLQWATVKENDTHKKAHGTILVGERNGNAKLTVSQVRSIISDVRPIRIIAKDYGIAHSSVHRIKTNARWRYLHEMVD